MTIGAEPTLAPSSGPAARRLISTPFFLLRGFSTAAVVAAALIQIYVFARAMSPQQFSIFILVGAVGYSFWLFEFGVVKFLFFRIRAAYLAGEKSDRLARQSTAVLALYIFVVACGTLGCFAVMAALPSVSAFEAAQYAMFFMFTALNLVWFALRNIGIAVDDYVYSECIEAARRIGSIVALAAILVGLPLTVFLVLVDLFWIATIAVAIVRLRRKGALVGGVRGAHVRLWKFYRDERHGLVRSGTSATSELYVEHLPYLIVPLAFGLGAPTIILDTIFKFFRGANLLHTAVGDLVVPRQTSALAERDAPTLIRATLLAATLSAIPTLSICALLLFAAQPIFARLLGPAATMPAEAVWIIVALLLGNLVQTIGHSLLIHSGYFRETARLAVFTVVCFTLAGAASLLAGFGIVAFLGVYAAIYAIGALLHVLFAVTGPIRAARAP